MRGGEGRGMEEEVVQVNSPIKGHELHTSFYPGLYNSINQNRMY